MLKITKYKHLFFLIFLPSYLIIQTTHGWEHILDPLLWIGVIVATLAHARRNILTLILLFSHMIIEWFEWGSTEILPWILLSNLFHTGMDFIFLHHEIKVHLKKDPTWILIGVFLTLFFIFSVTSQIEIPEQMIERTHPFVLGGVIGCVASHIYFHIKKE